MRHTLQGLSSIGLILLCSALPCAQVIKACALLSREADLLRCLARLQNLLGGYSEECLKLCSKRKQRQAASSGAAAAGQRNRLLTLPAAAAAGSITHWYRGQAQTPAAEPDAGSSTSMDDSDSLMATALGNMKFYLLNAPLAARVCTATSNSQVGGATTGLTLSLLAFVACRAMQMLA